MEKFLQQPYREGQQLARQRPILKVYVFRLAVLLFEGILIHEYPAKKKLRIPDKF